MRVIVTRPEADAPAWVQGLAQRGHEVLALPLIGVGPSADPHSVAQAWATLARYQAVMFVSGNAVNYFMAGSSRQSWPTSTRAWATGPGTHAALLNAGIGAEQIDAPDASAAQFDSEALWSRVVDTVRPGDAVLIVRGSDTPPAGSASANGVGRDWLAAQLLSVGAQVEFVVAYARCCPVWTELQRCTAQRSAVDGAVWLFSSSEAITNLQRLLPDTRWGGARAVATHARIAQAAQAAGFAVVRASRPNLSAVAASIESLA